MENGYVILKKKQKGNVSNLPGLSTPKQSDFSLKMLRTSSESEFNSALKKKKFKSNENW